MTGAILLAALTAATAPLPDTAQPMCFPSMSEMADYLADWREVPIGAGAVEGGGELVVFAGAQTWTLVAQFNGLVCVIEQGRAWINEGWL